MEVSMIKTYLVDAFTSQIFKGNPAGVCLLTNEIDTVLMQSIALELGQAETAFCYPLDDKYMIRWFTPKHEMPLCGHATLATAAILFDEDHSKDVIVFSSKSGELTVKRKNNRFSMDFPLDEPESVDESEFAELLEAMNITDYKTMFIGKTTRKLVIHLSDSSDIHRTKPNFNKLNQLELNIKGVGITAQSTDYDFISRYFNPWAGVNEDAVTGSVHTLLASYWSKLFDKRTLKAFQASQRGGEIMLEVSDRVQLIGDARIVLKGMINVNNS